MNTKNLQEQLIEDEDFVDVIEDEQIINDITDEDWIQEDDEETDEEVIDFYTNMIKDVISTN